VSSSRLTAEHAAVLAAMLDRLIPADEHGPGARAAGVCSYIERALAAEHHDQRDAYVRGLTALQAVARARHGRSFDRLDAAAQHALLAETEREATAFFERVRRHAIEGMFGDPRWGGNRGYAGWELLGYPGPRAEWTERDQRLDAVADGGPPP
jgi:gluconate 2-dehydrogenase gamma chain